MTLPTYEETLIDDVIHDLESLDFNSKEARDVVRKALRDRDTALVEMIDNFRDEIITRNGPNDTEFTRLAELSLFQEIRSLLLSHLQDTQLITSNNEEKK